MSSSGGGAAAFLGGAVVGFFFPRLVMRIGIGATSGIDGTPSDDGAPAERGAGAGDIKAGLLSFIPEAVDAEIPGPVPACVGYVDIVVVGMVDGIVGMSVTGVIGALVIFGEGRRGDILGA
jgi:hypothetical protein